MTRRVEGFSLLEQLKQLVLCEVSGFHESLSESRVTESLMVLDNLKIDESQVSESAMSFGWPLENLESIRVSSEFLS